MKPFVASAFVAFSILAVLAHAVVNDPKPIQLTVRPMIAFAPTDLQIKVRVHPGDEDRWISVQADNGEFSRRSDWTIEGDRPLYSFFWKDIPAGEYVVIASIGGTSLHASDRATVIVRGFGPVERSSALPQFPDRTRDQRVQRSALRRGCRP